MSNPSFHHIHQTQPTLNTKHMGMGGQMVAHSLSLVTQGTALLPKSALSLTAYVTLGWHLGAWLKSARGSHILGQPPQSDISSRS